MKNKISVIIVTFHSEKIIMQTIKHFSNQEIIVVECSGNYNLKEDLLKANSKIKFILAEKNLGYGAGNNLGIKKSSNEDVLILNPDALMDEKNIKELLKYINTIKDYGILCPSLERDICKNFSKKNNYIPVKVSWKAIGEGLISGCALLLNKKKLKDNIFFDENIFMYKEDTDMIKRVNEKKISVYFLPLSTVKHIGTSSHNKKYNHEIEISRQFHWPYGNVYFYLKHFGFLFTLKKWGRKYFSSIIKTIFYFLIINKKYKIYFARFLGISSALLKIKAWYRPKI
jgi:N-acetylglucosaminyl-diphospho-decaprenol L-rhamnosyltransferase